MKTNTKEVLGDAKNTGLSLTTKDLGKTIRIVTTTEAETPYYKPKTITLDGSIFAPAEFIKHRKGDYQKNKVHVTYSRSAGTIKLVCDETSEFAATVNGKLVLNPNLSALNINKEKTLSIDAMVKLLRFNMWIFADRKKGEAIVKELKEFDAKIVQTVKNNNDQRGNIEKEFTQKIQVNKDFEFTAQASVYLGCEPKTFKVELVAAIRTQAIEFWFESVELEEIEQLERDELIDSQIELLKDYVCVEQV